MSRILQRLGPLGLLFLIGIQTPLFAQTDSLPSAPPLGAEQQIPDEALLPGYEARIRQLKDAGFTDAEIKSMAEAMRESGQVPTTLPDGIKLPDQPGAVPGAASPEPVDPKKSADFRTEKIKANIVAPQNDPIQSQAPKKKPGPGGRQGDTLRLRPNLNAIGRKGVVFGHEIFDPSVNYARAESDIPPDDYLIGPGDIFNVTIWGAAELAESLTVDPDGSISRQYMGKVYLSGLSYGKAKKILRNKYRTIVSSKANIEVILSPNKRAITINVVGEVRKPGSYQIRSRTPGFDAIMAAGGITDIGTVRHIIIKRGGKIVEIADLYEFLIRGNNEPLYLQNNDFIFVPVQSRVVHISGGVRRPRSFELKDGENLKTLLEYAGGLKYDALTTSAQIIRLEDEGEKVTDISLGEIMEDDSRDFVLKNQDRIIIRSVNRRTSNVVQIFGDVSYPGTYQLMPGERVSDLINKAGGLLPEAYLDRAYVVRMVPATGDVIYLPIDLHKLDSDFDGSNNPALQYFDAVEVFSEKSFRDRHFIAVEGEVRRPGVYPTGPNLTLRDLLFLAGGPTRHAELKNVELGIITHGLAVGPPTAKGSPKRDQVITTQRVEVPKDWETNPSLDTVLLGGVDKVTIYSQYDYRFLQTIEITGAVMRPDRYPRKRGMSLRDAIYLAGGMAAGAAVKEVELYRIIGLDERGNFNTLVQEPEIVRVQIEKNWETSPSTEMLALDGFYRVVFRSESDFFQSGFVEVKGLVNLPGTYDVKPHMNLRDLLYMAGGIQLKADFNAIELTRIIQIEDETGEIRPVPIVLQRISTDQEWQKDSSLMEIEIHSFDQIFVRQNPLFKEQQSVYVFGEVRTTGEYNKELEDEKLSDLLRRAGGPTKLAYLEGAILIRRDIGAIAIKLEKAVKNPGSKYDIVLLEGDTLILPPRIEVVSVIGNVLNPGTKVMFEHDKTRLKYYVKQAGGFDRRTMRRKTTAIYMDGRVKPARSFLFFRSYPRIDQGTVIVVKAKPPKKEKEKGTGSKIDMNAVLGGAVAIITFYLLIDTALKR